MDGVLTGAAIQQLVELLGLSYKTSQQLDQLVDTLPSKRPQFRRHEIAVGGEPFEIYAREIMDCLVALWGDPEFAPILVVVPERHYADEDETIRVYFDVHTGKWWWATQVRFRHSYRQTYS